MVNVFPWIPTPIQRERARLGGGGLGGEVPQAAVPLREGPPDPLALRGGRVQAVGRGGAGPRTTKRGQCRKSGMTITADGNFF